MMRLNILTIYLKEMKEVLRDKRTLVFMVVVPTIMVPLLMSILIGFMSKAESKARSEVLQYAVFGEENLPDVANKFLSEEGFIKVDIAGPNDIETAIKENRIKFALVIPENARDNLEQGQQARVEIYYNNATIPSRVFNRASTVIQQIAGQFRENRLKNLGVDSTQMQESIINPIIVVDRGTAQKRERQGEQVGGMLPYFFIIFCFMGSMFPAIDLGAGEKERGTLETLLLAPIERRQIVLGKFLVIFTTGVTAALLSLTGMGVMLASRGKEITGELGQIIASISVVDLVLIASMLIPTAAMFAAVLLSVSVYARSFKEANSYCGPLNILALVPAFIAILPVVKLDWYWALVPITNISLAIKELIKGTMNYYMLIAILGSSFIIAGGFLYFCTKWFEREQVLFRE